MRDISTYNGDGGEYGPARIRTFFLMNVRRSEDHKEGVLTCENLMI